MGVPCLIRPHACLDAALPDLPQVAEEDELGAKPKRRGKVMSDYEKWEISQLIKSGGCRPPACCAGSRYLGRR